MDHVTLDYVIFSAVNGTLQPLCLQNKARLSACLVADCGRIDRREGAILGVLAEISQNPYAIRAGRRRESLSLLAGIVK